METETKTKYGMDQVLWTYFTNETGEKAVATVLYTVIKIFQSDNQ